MIEVAALSTLVVCLILLAGVLLLFGGSNLLVKGASRAARRLGVDPVVVGLTVVAFGTSMPEFLVSVFGALRGSYDISLGNIVGSNLANIGLVLGLAAIARPLIIHRRIASASGATENSSLAGKIFSYFRGDLPFLIFISLLFWAFTGNLWLGRVEGMLLFLIFLGYLAYVVEKARRASRQVRKEYSEFLNGKGSLVKDAACIVAGSAALALGADFTVRSAVEVSVRAGISQVFIGMTAVAVGTSLPELMVSLVASFKRESDISIGNVVGSNLMNTLGIAGPVAIIRPLKVNPTLPAFQIPWMILLTLFLYLILILKKERRIGRIEGGIFLALYLLVLGLSFPR